MIKNFFKKFSNISAKQDFSSDPVVCYVQRLLSKLNDSLLLRKNLNEITFTIIDTETTGLDKKKDKILSIAAVKIKNLKINDIYNVFVDAGVKIPEESKQFHGIDDKHLKNKPKINEILPDFINFLNDSVIVGHHIKFDMEMLNKEVENFFQAKISNYQIDTGILYNFLTDTEEKVSLDYLMDKYNVKCKDRHSALGDAIATAEVFIKLLSKFGSRFHSLEDLSQNNLLFNF